METPFEKPPIETGNPLQPELTPRQIYEEGQNLEQAGNKLGAAAQYEKAGYPHLAIGIYEESGDITKAYEIAKRSGDNFTADRLADKYNIAGHEFTDFPPARGRDFNEVMVVALKSRLQEGATAQQLGFSGFKDKIVVDIGTRDGRFVPLFRDLGAKEVFGIDPDGDALREAVDRGILDEEHALPVKLQDLPEAMRDKFEIATIFNFNMPRTEQDGYFQQLYENLPEGAQIVMTFAEDEILQNATPIMQKYFIVRSTKLWQKKEDYPHKNLVVCIKKPKEFAAREQNQV